MTKTPEALPTDNGPGSPGNIIRAGLAKAHDFMGIKSGPASDDDKDKFLIALALLQLEEHHTNRAAQPSGEAWMPIETAPTPADGRVLIERWHRVWKCVVTVLRFENISKAEDKAGWWVTGTLDQTWPEEAFEPFWRPQSAAPRAEAGKGV